MNRRLVVFGLVLFLLSCAIALPASAQTAKHSASTRKAPADTSARQQLASYMAQFRNHPDDLTLRNEIVGLAKTLTPEPAIPDTARASFTQATAQLGVASSPDDFRAAAKLFEQAALQAPWYADADFSAASAYAKALDSDGAKRNLAFYLAAVRPGVDTHSADDLRRDLDRQQSGQQLQQAMQQFKADPSDAARIEIIKLAQSLKTPPDIPEEARSHFVMAVVLGNTAEGDPGEEQHAVDEFKAALLAAPWWGEAYRKLATAQTVANQYDDAVASLNFYLLTQPADARNAQDEIYRLKALWQKTADAQQKQQVEEQRTKLQEEKKQQELAAIQAKKYTVEGRWYQASTPNDFFVGGDAIPDCDYYVQQNGGHWTITNTCSKSTRTIDNVEVQNRELSFRLTGHDRLYPFSEVVVTFSMSADGKTLLGRGTPYDKNFFPIGDHTVRWLRRE
ncbi:MAG: hypothetical protein ABR907_16715 [Terracidiphilus sp.]|jgi:hypothetical protein